MTKITPKPVRKATARQPSVRPTRVLDRFEETWRKFSRSSSEAPRHTMTASRQDNARNHNDTPGGPTPIVMKAMNKVSTAIKTAKEDLLIASVVHGSGEDGR